MIPSGIALKMDEWVTPAIFINSAILVSIIALLQTSIPKQLSNDINLMS
jgi:hypothetical protein